MIVVSSSLSRIYLLRHADAGWPENGQKDFDRALSDAGYAQAEMVTDRAADKNYRPDVVVSSTALRCRQTADAVRRNLSEDATPFRFVDELYDSPLKIYLEILSAADHTGSMMIIGHNPAICETLQFLIGATQLGNIIPHGYPTCGLAVLERRANAGPAQPGWRAIDFIEA
jgi:phosphohistidine phosphatase